MSSRPGILVSHRFPHGSDLPPNQTKDYITVEIRAYWPHNATEEDIGSYLSGCYLEALRALKARVGSPTRTNAWLLAPESP